MNSHKAAHHLFGVFRTPRIGKADERAVHGHPGTPFELCRRGKMEEKSHFNFSTDLDFISGT